MAKAYLLGELNWPMPDMGLVAVWRAMPIDSSRWTDWDGFVDATYQGSTVGMLVDQAGAPFKLDLDEKGARLRARLSDADAPCWQQLAIAWRAAIPQRGAHPERTLSERSESKRKSNERAAGAGSSGMKA